MCLVVDTTFKAHIEMISTEILLIFLSLSLVLLLIYNWKRRWLYSYSFKVNGPLSFPLIGSAYLLINIPKEDVYKKFCEMYQKYNPIFKMWLGPDLYIFPSKPKDVEKIFKNCLQKGPPYKFAYSFLGHGLLTAPVEMWKKHRKVLNFFFSQKTLNSHFGIFVKNSKDLAQKLKQKKESFDIFQDFFNCSAKSSCDIFIGSDSLSSEERIQYFSKILRIEELVVQRSLSPLLQFDFFWKLSSLYREENALSKESWAFIKKVIENNTNNNSSSFLNQLVKMSEDEWSIEEIMDELQTMLVTASETSPTTQSFAMLMLALHPHIQKQVQQELFEIFGSSTRDPTLEDLNKMVYLEGVIKETIRLFPARPMVFRHIDSDILLDSHVVPKGSTAAILIGCIQRDPTIWPEPLKFNPDRFLLEGTTKMEPYAFLGFSTPPRNCIGQKFAMMSLKITLSTILRRFEVVSCQYKSMDDIRLVIEVLLTTADGFNITLKSRDN